MDAKISSQNQNQSKVLQASTSRHPQFKLPDDWVVERRSRSKQGNRPNLIDKYYIEPETGKRFRSLRSVEKYLTEGKKHTATPGALKAGDRFIPSKSSGSQKKRVSSKKVETSKLGSSSTPATIKWVLSGPGGVVWNPFMDGSLVPESIKRKWPETFVLALFDRL